MLAAGRLPERVKRTGAMSLGARVWVEVTRVLYNEGAGLRLSEGGAFAFYVELVCSAVPGQGKMKRAGVASARSTICVCNAVSLLESASWSGGQAWANMRKQTPL